MTLSLVNTLSHELEPVVPLEEGHVRIYTCGPTVYARAHVGNFRTFIFEDILRRWLDRSFQHVTHVMNLTDVDDKIIRNATAHHTTLSEETGPYIDGFFEDLDSLGIRRAHYYPKATEYIEQMIDIIEKLQGNGHTYERDGSVYYRISTFPNYGKLSGMKSDGLIDGGSGRVDADEYSKDDARDFALWKAVGPEDIGWDTRLGRGRPGWHIECSAMSSALLGESFDIHCGGIDNIFPHHENEIAQSEGATGKQFVQMWCHSAHLQIDSEKMSKSLDNFFTVDDLIRKGNTSPAAIRYLLSATVHYRKQLNYSSTTLAMAAEGVERWVTFYNRIDEMVPGDEIHHIVPIVDKTWELFQESMDNDLNLPEAMGFVFQTVRDLNRMADSSPFSAEEQEHVLKLINDVDSILGILPLALKEKDYDLAPAAVALLNKRSAARESKDWKLSDSIRDELLAIGISVEDTAAGQKWHKTSK